MIELASVRDPGQVADAVASTLDLAPRAGSSALERVVEVLSGCRSLLVLDNCEHLIGAVAELVERVSRRGRHLDVLATSREPLNIDGEQVIRLRPLAIASDAVELFIDRARTHAELSLDEVSRPLVARICETLDGLPLAIELAAARCASMTLSEIIDGLDERFAFLVGGRRTAHERHGSLRALVEWSVRALDPQLETVFLGTSIFSGGFTAADAAAVTGLETATVRQALGELIERSLLGDQPAPGRPTRYHYLETIRTYAAERYIDQPDADVVTFRHGEWALGLAERARAALTTADDLDAIETMMASLPDLRVAHHRFLASGDADRSIRLATSLRFIAMFRMQAELFGWIRAVADRFGGLEHPLIEDLLASASIGTWQAGDIEGARSYAERAEQVASGSTRPGAGRAAHEALADVEQFQGDDEAAAGHFEAALRLAREQADELRVITDLADLAMIRAYMGQIDRADAALSEARSLVEANGSVSLGCWVSYAEGEAMAEADPDRAVAALGRALALAEDSSAHFVLRVAGLTRAGLRARHGDPVAAVPDVIELMEHWRRDGARLQQWITLRTVVDLLVRLGHESEAAIVLGAVRATDEAEAAGSDAIRLVEAAAYLERTLPDARKLFDHGASLDLHAVIELSVDCLQSLVDAGPGS